MNSPTSNPTDKSLLPVLTQQKHVSFLWIVMMNLTWFIGIFTMFVVGTVMPFTLRRFTDDTRLIGLVCSVGLWFGIVLGPLVNYVSDRIWTRFGRRRPFMLVAVCGSLLATICIPFIPTLTPLILVVVVSSILGDVGSTQEPLWLEVIPPGQRGQGFAVRAWAVQMASLLFFQVMFAQMDSRYHIGQFILTGEQTCYLSAAVLQLGYFVLLGFLIREVRPEGARLQNPSEIQSEQLIRVIRAGFAEPRWWHYLLLSPLPAPWMLYLAEKHKQRWLLLLLFPAAFMIRFVRDVFGEPRWWWVYLFYVSGTFITAGGNFANLMLVEQFHYSKPNIARTGWPVLITPFMGWFADRLPRIRPLLLGTVTIGGAVGLWYFMGFWSAVPKLELPPFWAMMVLATLAAVSTGAFAIWCFQGVRQIAPNVNPRIWAWVLCNAKAMLLVSATYLAIKVFSTGGVPSLTLWFVIMCLNTGISCLFIVAGPLYYDLLPKDKIGTLSSGCGLLSTTLNAFISTLVGSWIFYFTKWTTGSTVTKDYSSYMVMQMTLGLVTLALTAVFAYRFVKGRMVEYGRHGLNSTDPAPAAPTP